jgi:hypothetical protein
MGLLMVFVLFIFGECCKSFTPARSMAMVLELLLRKQIKQNIKIIAVVLELLFRKQIKQNTCFSSPHQQTFTINVVSNKIHICINLFLNE